MIASCCKRYCSKTLFFDRDSQSLLSKNPLDIYIWSFNNYAYLIRLISIQFNDNL